MSKVTQKKTDEYDDPTHDYLKFWDSRRYEHQAEEIAIARLLRGKRFKKAVDLGGGFGRLSAQLQAYADDVTLVEPSQHQLDIAKRFLERHPAIKFLRMLANNLKFERDSVDLLIMIRVLHHLPDPGAEFREIARVLSGDGCAIIEVANYTHFRNRLRHCVRQKPLPLEPVDIRSAASRAADKIAFVNHNPSTVIGQLAGAGLKVESTLSVSNLRSVRLKKIMPREVMLGAERILQRPLASIYFGPSIFFLVRKASDARPPITNLEKLG